MFVKWYQFRSDGISFCVGCGWKGGRDRIGNWLRLDGASHIEAKSGGESIILLLETKDLC